MSEHLFLLGALLYIIAMILNIYNTISKGKGDA